MRYRQHVILATVYVILFLTAVIIIILFNQRNVCVCELVIRCMGCSL